MNCNKSHKWNNVIRPGASAGEVDESQTSRRATAEAPDRITLLHECELLHYSVERPPAPLWRTGGSFKEYGP